MATFLIKDSDMPSNPCEWCKNTSEQIDSLEYENEELKKQMDELKASNERQIQFLLGRLASFVEHVKATGE